MTWIDAVIGFFASLPWIGKVVTRWIDRRDSAAKEKQKDSAHEDAQNLDPDRLGDRLRRGMQRRG